MTKKLETETIKDEALEDVQGGKFGNWGMTAGPTPMPYPNVATVTPTVEVAEPLEIDTPISVIVNNSH